MSHYIGIPANTPEHVGFIEAIKNAQHIQQGLIFPGTFHVTIAYLESATRARANTILRTYRNTYSYQLTGNIQFSNINTFNDMRYPDEAVYALLPTLQSEEQLKHMRATIREIAKINTSKKRMSGVNDWIPHITIARGPRSQIHALERSILPYMLELPLANISVFPAK